MTVRFFNSPLGQFCERAVAPVRQKGPEFPPQFRGFRAGGCFIMTVLTPILKNGGLKCLQLKMRGGKMKGHISTRVLVGLVATLLIGMAGFAQQEKPVKTIKGEVVDLWCYMDHGARGPKHQACAVACAKMGNPIGIVDAEGNAYMAVGAGLHQPYRDELIQKMAQNVTVKGTVVDRGGLKMIYIKSIS
jgi:hypothetical protein